jgi:hypothetical protein
VWQWAGFGKRVLIQEAEVDGADGDGDIESEDSEGRHDRLAEQRLAQARQSWEEEMHAGVHPPSPEESDGSDGVVFNGVGQMDGVEDSSPSVYQSAEGSLMTVYLSAEEEGGVAVEQGSASSEEETGEHMDF